MTHTSILFAFFGTDDFSVTVLEELRKKGFVPMLIVTPPDRKKGRGLLLTETSVKKWALAHNIDYLQPVALTSAVSYQLKAKSCQLFVVASYGLIIPKAVLEIPKYGTLNVHPPLLPKYRGATPIEHQVLNDEREVGVSIMLVDDKLDHGPIIAQKQIQDSGSKIQEPPKASKLRETMARVGGEMLAEVMPKWIEGEISAKPQDHLRATYTKKLAKTDGEISLSDDPYRNFLKIQAFEGSIGTYFFYSPSEATPFTKGNNIRVIIKDAKFEDGKLVILRVMPEGKREMSYEEFLRGVRK